MKLLPYLFGTHRLNKCRRHPEFCREGDVRSGTFPNISSLFRSKLCLSRIATLLCYRCPATITRFVPAIIVDTLKSKAGGFFSHIGEKILKAVQPSLADIYAAVPVILRHRVAVISASGLHVDPSGVSARLGHPMSWFRSTWVHDSSSTERLWKVTGQCLSTGPLRFVA